MRDKNYRDASRRQIVITLKMSIKSIINDFRKTINNENVIFDSFADLSTDDERFKFSKPLFREYLNKMCYERAGKSATKSRVFRETGNVHFRNGDFWKAVTSYTQSLAHAPQDGTLEFYQALGNRSAALLHLNLVKESLSDVEKVLSMNIADEYRNKMQARREKCLKSVNVRSIRTDFDAVELKTKSEVVTSASTAVDARCDEVFGRYLFANSDVKTGEVLIVEKPYSSVLVPNHVYTHCNGCFRRSFNLIPCPNCATSVYCSERCVYESRESHKIECKIMAALIALQTTNLELLSVRTLINASEQGQKLKELTCGLCKINETNDFMNIPYNSNDHINIYKLVGNTGKRNCSDLFNKSLTTCLLVDVLDKIGDLFELYSGAEKDLLIDSAGGLILRYLQSMPCNAHEISEYCDSGYDEIGAGAYAALSLINHSCDPNVVRHSYGSTLVLTAIRPIQKGEQLFDNYGYHYAVFSKLERQSSLMKQYFFECLCEACLKNWPQQDGLPDANPVFKDGIDVKKYELMSEVFQKNVEDIFQGELKNEIIRELSDYLDFLDDYVERPWKSYNVCQEAIKHCLGLRGNCFRLSKGV